MKVWRLPSARAGMAYIGVFVACFIAGWVFFKPEIKVFAKGLIRRAHIVQLGKQEYVRRRIAQETAPLDVGAKADSQLLQTAVLPLRVTSVKIAASVEFPAGAGGLTQVGNSLLIMDRLGGMYSSDGVRVRKLELPALPNRLDMLLTRSSSGDITMDTFRTHSIAYSSHEGRLYATYERYVDSTHNAFELSSILLDETSLQAKGDWEKVFQSPPYDAGSYGLAGGGKILVVKNRIFFTVGDYGFYASRDRPLHAAQDANSVFGKIFELESNGRAVIVSIGHRNAQGLVWSSEGQLINVEEGPQGGDELNVIEKGKNYGWPIETFGTDYGKYTWALKVDSPGVVLEAPLYSFVPSVAADSIVQVRNFHPRWNGDFLVGSLKAQTLFRLRIQSGRVLLAEPIWLGQRIREFVEIGSRLVVLTDSGLLMTIAVDKPELERNGRSVDTVTGLAMSTCMSCHHLGPTNPSHLAPSLSSLQGRVVASDSYDRYSPALKKLEGVWTRERVKQFLSNPSLMAPGTAMPKIDLKDGELNAVLDEIFAN